MGTPPASTPLQTWIAGFLQSRGLGAPSAQPLHRYHASPAELADLKQLLREHRESLDIPEHRPSWAAGLCLYAAEMCRRQQDEDTPWNWTLLEQALECTLPEERTRLIEIGLSSWKRPRPRSEGTSELPEWLRIESGLRWPLVVRHAERLDTALHRALRHYHRTRAEGETLAGLLMQCDPPLPEVFRGIDARQLLAGIIEQLMTLTSQHPLLEEPDPAAYLDQHAAHWQRAFPLLLEEPQARTLLAGWLKEAARRQPQQDPTERPRIVSCRHRLLKTGPDWQLCAELTLPAEETIRIEDPRALSGTRLVVALYEGEQLVQLRGALHAQAVEEGLKLQYPAGPLVLPRQTLTEPISLRLLEGGRCIHAVPFDGSALDFNELPLVFETREEQQWLIATASCGVAAATVQVRVPPGAECESTGTRKLRELFVEDNGARWIEASTELLIRKDEETYRIAVKQRQPTGTPPSLQGERPALASLPAGFVTWPTLALPEGAGDTESLELLINGKPPLAQASQVPGTYVCSVRTRDGDTVLRQSISILPSTFAVSLSPGEPSKLRVTGAKGCTWKLLSETGEALGESKARAKVPNELEIPLALPNPVPVQLKLEIGAAGGKPVTVLLDYPSPGARLIDRTGRETPVRDLLLDELQDARIVLAPGSASGQEFHLQLDLLSSAGTGLRHHQMVRVGETPLVVSLGGFLAQIQQMLGAVEDPDAYVRLAVETDHPVLRINIRRFAAGLEHKEGTYRVIGLDGNSLETGAELEARPFASFGRTAIALSKNEAGLFTVPETPQGPWLIYPAKSSTVRLRPELHGTATPASGLLQPQAGAEIIDPLLRAMVSDLDHAGWQQLDELKRCFPHLPLATFQSWRSLGRHAEALAAALLRLEADEAFCERIHDELAVLWECIPVDVWVKAFVRFRGWASVQGYPQAQLSHLLNNRLRVLRAVVPGLDFIGDYLGSGQKNTLKKPPIELVLPYHYQELRRTHQANARWPTELAMPLATWLERQRLPRSIRKLSNTAYSDAVTYLPIFMAHVTAGKASLSALPGESAYVKLVIRRISEFDRGWYLYVHSLLVSYLMAADA